MAKTPTSGASAYATPADFLARTDAGLLGDFVRDDGAQDSATQLLADTNLATALVDASGLVEAYCEAGGRYTVDDLQALTGNGLGLLKRIVCGLAIQFLRNRRGAIEPGQYPQYDFALRMLELLSEGAAIFPFAETAAAGLPDTEVMEPSDYWQGLPTLMTNRTRAWGFRQNRRFNY